MADTILPKDADTDRLIRCECGRATPCHHCPEGTPTYWTDAGVDAFIAGIKAKTEHIQHLHRLADLIETCVPGDEATRRGCADLVRSEAARVGGQ